MSSPRSIPTVDLRDLTSDDPARRTRAADALRLGFGHYGLVYVAGHGVDAAGVSELYDSYQAFARRPEAEKATLGGEPVWFQRGWTPPNTEKAVLAGGQPDFKECYFVAPLPSPEGAKRQYPQIHADNVWPEAGAGFDADAFRARYLAMGKALHEAGATLLRGAALALGLDEATFVERIDGGAHVTRLLRYLPLDATQVGSGILWGEEHTDFNLLTLLPGGRFYDPQGKSAPRPDDASGLFLRTRGTDEHPDGELVRGVAPEGCIVAQVGQQLEILTGGTFLATPHVITATKVPGWSRMSAAHFVHAHAEAILAPLPPFRGDAQLEAYGPPVLASTYSLKTLVDIGLAPKTALDKLGYRHYERLAKTRTPKTA